MTDPDFTCKCGELVHVTRRQGGTKRKTKPLDARFMAKVRKGAPGECWEWTGARTPAGYGNIWTGERYEKAHRLAYLLFRGAIPEGAVVCHSCDNPSCVNPDHLWAGAQVENVADMYRKGRQRRGDQSGSRNGRAKLTPDAVDAIRAAPRTPESATILARQYGVSDLTIRKVRGGKSWRNQ